MVSTAYQSLSESPLWRMQREYFEAAGARAWIDNIVPSYITTNACIAARYASVALARMQDCFGGDRQAKPFQIVELGAGSGRFAYGFLRHFLPHCARDFPHVRVRYVLTDASASVLAGCRTHPGFQEFTREGVLTFAVFDPLASEAAPSFEIGADSCFVIANYVFDGLPFDVFEVRDGEPRRMLARVVDEAKSPSPPLATVRLEYTAGQSGPQYPGVVWNSTLEHCAAQIRSGYLSLPVGALRCIDNLRRWCEDRLMLLVADKGPVEFSASVGATADAEPPQPKFHGSVSFDVDFRLLLDSLRRAGGRVYASGPDSHLVIAACEFSPAARARGEVTDTYENIAASRSFVFEIFRGSIMHDGPQKFFQLKRRFEERRPVLDADGLREWLRAACGDPVALNLAYSDALLANLAREISEQNTQESTEARRQSLRDTLLSVEALFFPLGGDAEEDTFFSLGNLFGVLGFYADAARCFESSLAVYGEDRNTAANLAECHRRLASVP